jgi:hypothetical protein
MGVILSSYANHELRKVPFFVPAASPMAEPAGLRTIAAFKVILLRLATHALDEVFSGDDHRLPFRLRLQPVAAM